MGHFSPCVQALSVTEAAETTMSLPRAVRSSGTRSADSLAGTETRARSSGGQLLVVPAAVPGSPLTHRPPGPPPAPHTEAESWPGPASGWWLPIPLFSVDCGFPGPLGESQWLNLMGWTENPEVAPHQLPTLLAIPCPPSWQPLSSPWLWRLKETVLLFSSSHLGGFHSVRVHKDMVLLQADLSVVFSPQGTRDKSFDM